MPVIIENAQSPAEAPARSWPKAMLRGSFHRCPACGAGSVFSGFITVKDRCSRCGEELHHQRADDAPPYFTITIVAHIIIPLLLIVERLWQPDYLVHAAIWIPATLILTLLLMPAVKGAVIGLQWALRMHGFGGREEE
jgi:uncharacterized protein (DUF983 family)